MFSLLKLI